MSEKLGTFVSHVPQNTATKLNLNPSRNGGQQRAFFRARPLGNTLFNFQPDPARLDTNLMSSIVSDLPPINIAADDVLSNQDLFDGTIIAIILAFLFSFLQGRSPSSSNIKLWPEDRKENDTFTLYNSLDEQLMSDAKSSAGNKEENSDSSEKMPITFDAKEWRDISRPENYILYTSKIRNKTQKQKKGTKAATTNTMSKENRVVFFALLALFVPIFSVEFFFALSRQFICGNYVTEVNDSMWLINDDRAASAINGISPWARELCSPHK